jgi:hypothetical protein
MTRRWVVIAMLLLRLWRQTCLEVDQLYVYSYWYRRVVLLCTSYFDLYIQRHMRWRTILLRIWKIWHSMHECAYYFYLPITATGPDDSSSVVGSAGNWAGPGQPGPSPLCFVLNGFEPAKPKIFLARAVPARSVKTVAQPGPKPRRAFFGHCRPKPGPYIWPY